MSYTHRHRHYYIRMPLQHLHDLPCLQIPQIHPIILAPRNDPLPARHTKARRDAVLVVLVAGVRLEASRGLVVPQADRVVVRGGEDVL